MPALLALALQLAPAFPLISRWLTGDNPAPIAEKIVSIATAVTNAANPEEAVKAILANQVAQQNFQIAMNAAAVDLEKAYLTDRASARERDVKIVQTRGNNQRGDVLAYMAIGALVLDMWALMFHDLPEANREIMLVAFGSLVTIVKDVYGFEFGSSKSSERNSQALSNYIATDKTTADTDNTNANTAANANAGR